MSGTIEPPTRIPFGPFEADLPSQELRKQGVRLRLPRQSFQILKMLLEHEGGLVSREEIRKRLWPDDINVDFDAGINAAILKLRSALRGESNRDGWIETVPRRGYRLLIPIRNGDKQPPATSDDAIGGEPLKELISRM